MRSWYPKMSGHATGQSHCYDHFAMESGKDNASYYGFPQEPHASFSQPPPAKSARFEYDLGPGSTSASIGPRSYAGCNKAGYQTASANPLTKDACNPRCSHVPTFDQMQPALPNQYSIPFDGTGNSFSASNHHYQPHQRYDISHPPPSSAFVRPHACQQSGSHPNMNYPKPQKRFASAWPPRGPCGPMNAIVPGPANSINRSGEPVSLLDATFTPPSGLPMLVRRERSLTRWAKAVRRAWPSQQQQQHDSVLATSFLSDVLQRELGKNMTFVYGALRDVSLSDRGLKGEFYAQEASEASVLVDLFYDDVFVAQGVGAERVEAREDASQKALRLFLQERIFVVGCYRLWEGELIPGFCVSNSRQASPRLPPHPRNPKRERATSNKPDSKTLPWLQVNPSSKMDTSDRLKPKSMKDFFILINGRGDDYSEPEKLSHDFSNGFPKGLNAVAVINNSAQFNQMKVEYRTSRASNRSQNCVVVLDGQEVGEAVGADSNQARRLACEAVLDGLSRTQPVVRMQLDKAQVVTPTELDGWAAKLAGEQPDWATAMDAGLDPANPMKEPHLQKVMDDAEAFLKQYIHDEKQEPLKFGSEFTHDERMAIHKAARRLGLASKPYGPQWRLYQVVSLRFSLDELKRILLSKGVAGRYSLVCRGSVDLSQETVDDDEATDNVQNETSSPVREVDSK